MQKEERANRGTNSKGSNQNIFLIATGNQNAFDVSEFTEKHEKLQSNLLAVMKPLKKIVRLYRCFGCRRNRPLKQMSGCLLFCRDCYAAAQDKGKTAQTNFLERALNNIQGYLRRGVV